MHTPESRYYRMVKEAWAEYGRLLHNARTRAQIRRAWDITERRLDEIKASYVKSQRGSKEDRLVS